jgi:thiamine-monophosphate kinase
MIDEDKLIQSLEKHSSGFIGDDAAVIPFTENTNYVVTKDLLIEDIHFRTAYFAPEDLAHKAVHVNLSDIAAMGAKPLYILCGIAVPPNLHEYATRISKHLILLCKQLNIILIGGDTTASKDKLCISITAIGSGKKNHIKYRSAAKNGDAICIIGNIGFAHIGFSLLEEKASSHSKYIASFLRPTAKIKEGMWLAQQAGVNSMMDVSDGAIVDLKRLCKSSNKGAIINLDSFQQHLEPDIPLKVALKGGEDYSLLCTVDEKSFALLAQEFIHAFNYEIKVIGYITSAEGIKFSQNNKEVELYIDSFTHFGEKPHE